ncbi:hypothetical protein [Haloglomus litoreum]|uniref:hypothetical protein n=1 Tax=Haloglomus litoreum TaxID=3034026 RepID=UPI0023E8525A|nr:hypothetical protein [Haloglomus sp. DT116]
MALSRRAYLTAIPGMVGGAALGTGIVGAGAAGPTFVLAQGDRCVTLRPLRGDRPVEAFYDYQLPSDRYEGFGASDDGGPYFSSRGTTALQRVDTSLLFLYEGPDGLSLVLVHGKADESDRGGGSATFTFEGLPADGEWVVRDDLYFDQETGERASSNYDRWRLGETTAQVSWTWAATGTDGGAFRGLDEETALTIDPAFNDDAERLSTNYTGTVTDWQALSARDGGVRRYSLRLDRPILLLAGTCDSLVGDDDGSDDSDDAERDGDDDDDAERDIDDDDREDDDDDDDGRAQRRGPDGDGPPGPDGNGPPGPDGNGPPGPDGNGPPGLNGNGPPGPNGNGPPGGSR